MIKISLHVSCEDAPDKAVQAAQAVAESACAMFKRRLENHAAQTPTTITQSVTITKSVNQASAESSTGVNAVRTAFAGPSLHEPSLAEPPLEEFPFEELTPEERLIATLKQLLMDAEVVAQRRGDISLCDAMTDKGQPYPSQQMVEVLSVIAREGYEPL